MNKPILQFDFKMKNSEEPIYFSEPQDIIFTWNIAEVDRCLRAVEKAIQLGYYAAGYISYEASYAIYSIDRKPQHRMPLIWFGIFKEPTRPPKNRLKNYSISNWKINQSKETYYEKFNFITEKINNNETNQINYTVQFQADFTGDSFAYYERLKRSQRANYCAYLDIGDHQILSVSPELFFSLKNNVITVKPMKGTIHRGKTYEEDITLKHWLKTSKKNMIENELITQLMKNELLNVAEPSSIQISDRYKIEKYPTVFQMTSTVRGNILPELTVIDVLKSLFPCGSISGVPKKTTIDMIACLETTARDVYCGAIGYITPKKEAIFNVPIRTVMIEHSTGIARYGAGGAITSSSNKDEEFKEVFTKTKVLELNRQPFQLLETFGLYNGKYIVFDEHMIRLQQSASYFSFNIDMHRIKKQLMSYAIKHPNGNWRVRLLLDEHGKETIESYPLHKTLHTAVKLAHKPIDKENVFLYHKTTNRDIYNECFEHQSHLFDVLLWNNKKEITEFTIGNVVVQLNGELFTPPIECGLLPGTFRKKLLEEGKVKERKIYIHELDKCSKIWLINSVRKWIEVHFIED